MKNIRFSDIEAPNGKYVYTMPLTDDVSVLKKVGKALSHAGSIKLFVNNRTYYFKDGKVIKNKKRN